MTEPKPEVTKDGRDERAQAKEEKSAVPDAIPTIPMGIGRPNLEYTKDYGVKSGSTESVTIHMKLELGGLATQTYQAVMAGFAAALTDRRALKAALEKVIDEKYPNFEGGKQLIRGIIDTPT